MSEEGQNPPPPPPPNDGMEMLIKFLKLKPPTFDGTPDPMQYEYWKRKIEGLFEVMECPTNYRVRFAAHLFEKDASFWWDTVKPREGEQPLTWEEFKGLLDEKYYPKEVKWAKEQEFLNLQQGKKPVIEYMSKFNELSRFAPHQVANEEMKMERFERGLKSKLKTNMAALTFPNLQTMYQKAIKVERVIDESEAFELAMQQKRKREVESSQGGVRGNGKKPHPNYQSQKDRTPYEPRPRCDTCGKLHNGPCARLTGACFGCGEIGHYQNQCPKKVQGNVQANQRTQSANRQGGNHLQARK